MLARQPAAQLMRRLAGSGAVQSCRTIADSVAAEVPNAPPILGAAFLERFPVILPEPPQWEVEHHTYMHELRDRQKKHYPPEFIDEKRTIGASATAAETAALWQPAPRRTAADEANDRRSTDRRLDERLILLLKSPGRSGGGGVWHLPFVEHQDSETIRESAERALQETTGGELRAFTVGNPPAAFHPLADGSGVLFYIRMQLLEGNLSTAAVPKGQRWYDFAWVAASELPEYFEQDPDQAALLQDVL